MEDQDLRSFLSSPVASSLKGARSRQSRFKSGKAAADEFQLDIAEINLFDY